MANQWLYEASFNNRVSFFSLRRRNSVSQSSTLCAYLEIKAFFLLNSSSSSFMSYTFEVRSDAKKESRS